MSQARPISVRLDDCGNAFDAAEVRRRALAHQRERARRELERLGEGPVELVCAGCKEVKFALGDGGLCAKCYWSSPRPTRPTIRRPIEEEPVKSKCPVCKKPLPASTTGRARVYDSKQCSYRAAYRRKQGLPLADDEQPAAGDEESEAEESEAELEAEESEAELEESEESEAELEEPEASEELEESQPSTAGSSDEVLDDDNDRPRRSGVVEWRFDGDGARDRREVDRSAGELGGAVLGLFGRALRVACWRAVDAANKRLDELAG